MGASFGITFRHLVELDNLANSIREFNGILPRIVIEIREIFFLTTDRIDAILKSSSDRFVITFVIGLIIAYYLTFGYWKTEKFFGLYIYPNRRKIGSLNCVLLVVMLVSYASIYIMYFTSVH